MNIGILVLISCISIVDIVFITSATMSFFKHSKLILKNASGTKCLSSFIKEVPSVNKHLYSICIYRWIQCSEQFTGKRNVRSMVVSKMTYPVRNNNC